MKRPSFLVEAARNSLDITLLTGGANGVDRITSPVSKTALSHVSAAIPIGGVVVGAYYSSEPRLHGPSPNATFGSGTPFTSPECPNGCGVFLPIFNLAFDRQDRRCGLALGWERGAVAIGAGAEMEQIDERSETVRTLLQFSDQGTTSYPQRVFRRTSDRAIVPNAGIRWRVSPRVALAAAYNGAGSFIRSTSVCSLEQFAWDTCTSNVVQLGSTTVRMPDAYRAGASVGVTSRLQVVAEAVRRNYGKLADDPFSILSTFARFPYHDVTEIHAGAEYKLASLPLALRAGWWRDPARFSATYSILGQTVQHYTFGTGVNIGSTRLDLAYDAGDHGVQRRAVVGLAFALD